VTERNIVREIAKNRGVKINLEANGTVRSPALGLGKIEVKTSINPSSAAA